MMSWGLKISRNNSKQSFKFGFCEEQELNRGQELWCVPGDVLAMSRELGMQLSLRPKLKCTVVFPNGKRNIQTSHVSITRVSPPPSLIRWKSSCGLSATSAQVELARLISMWGAPKGARNRSFGGNLKYFTCPEYKIQFSRWCVSPYCSFFNLLKKKKKLIFGWKLKLNQ